MSRNVQGNSGRMVMSIRTGVQCPGFRVHTCGSHRATSGTSEYHFTKRGRSDGEARQALSVHRDGKKDRH